jgi:hypothetical protein
MYTVTVKDKTFSSKFELTSKRDDYIHALVVWFAVDFSKCHRNIRLSTSPEGEYSKHLDFYLLVFNYSFVVFSSTLETNSLLSGFHHCHPAWGKVARNLQFESGQAKYCKPTFSGDVRRHWSRV